MPHPTRAGSRTDNQNQHRPVKGGTTALAAFALLLGGLFFYAGYRYMERQFDRLREDVESRTVVSVAEIHRANSARLDHLAETLSRLTAEMDAVKHALETAGLSVSASASLQAALQQQLEELKRQLADLQRAIELIEGNR